MAIACRHSHLRPPVAAVFPLSILLSLSSAACSSSDEKDSSKDPDAGVSVCKPNAALVARRDACEFGPGAMVSETIGGCTGAKIPIENVVIIMQENRSFDDYFGHLPGHGQDDVDVPQGDVSNPDPSGAPIAWYKETQYCVADTDHGWVASHAQWNNGMMDGFATSNVTTDDPTGHRALGYYEQTDLPFYYELASTFAISDRYFCSLLGPTYPNRFYFYGGTSYGIVTTDLSILAPPNSPQLLKSLTEKGISWKIYKTNLASIWLYPDWGLDMAQAPNIVDVSQFAVDAAAGALPSVALVEGAFSGKAWEETDEHPPANPQVGQHWVYEQLQALVKSPQWPKSALFITYDEHGGLYDHVSPPPACVPDDTPPALSPELGGFDRLGFRVPAFVVSPYAKRHFVSHEVHSHTSILRFIQAKFELPAFTKRDANSDDMLDFFDFDSPPNVDVPDFAEPPVDAAQITLCQQNFP